LDLAAARELHTFNNRRDYKRFESLIKNLGVLLVAANGGDAKKLIDQYSGEEEEENESVDNPNEL
jgi:hypothetical protein